MYTFFIRVIIRCLGVKPDADKVEEVKALVRQAKKTFNEDMNAGFFTYAKEQHALACEELRKFNSDPSPKILSLNNEKREKIRAKLIRNIDCYRKMMDSCVS